MRSGLQSRGLEVCGVAGCLVAGFLSCWVAGLAGRRRDHFDRLLGRRLLRDQETPRSGRATGLAAVISNRRNRGVEGRVKRWSAMRNPLPKHEDRCVGGRFLAHPPSRNDSARQPSNAATQQPSNPATYQPSNPATSIHPPSLTKPHPSRTSSRVSTWRFSWTAH
jgi:hypothetical protein